MHYIDNDDLDLNGDNDSNDSSNDSDPSVVESFKKHRLEQLNPNSKAKSSTENKFPSRWIEEYAVRVLHTPSSAPPHSNLPNPVTPTHCTVSTLTPYNLSVISTIMGQTVALDHYNNIVDGLLTRFDLVNEGVVHEVRATIAIAIVTIATITIADRKNINININ